MHDIMKNPSLLPTVQEEHAPFEGFQKGEIINDHDVALAYVMEHYPNILPSYGALEPGQRAPLLFTQSRMNFNMGWMVQGESPPGALFSSFKKIIRNGSASQADINFYFIHWLTDIAGAEPFGDRFWPGCEKFTLKFPTKVLAAFLDSFRFVDGLATQSEVEVMQDYLSSRMRDIGIDSTLQEKGHVALARLCLMAQGFEHEMAKCFKLLPDDDFRVLSDELSRSGCTEKFQGPPSDLEGGPAVLIYYAPALVQKGGATECILSLRILAELFRASRKLFPLVADVASTVTVRIDQMKSSLPSEIVWINWSLVRISSLEAELRDKLDDEVLMEMDSVPAVNKDQVQVTFTTDYPC